MDKINYIKKRMLITAGLSLVAMGATAYFVILPQIDNIKNTKNEIERQRVDLEKKYVQGQNLKKITENIKKVEEKIDDMEEIYVRQEEALEFVTSLEDIAEKNSVDQRIELTPAKNNSNPRIGYQKSPLQIAVNGRYQNVLSYLSDLETLDYYVNIDNTNMAKASSNKEPPESNVNLRIQAHIYWKG